MAQNGLDNFIMGFTHSLEVNSEEIVDVLTLLSNKELTKGDKKILNGIAKQLKSIDKDINTIGR